MSSASLHGPGSPPRGRGKVDGPPAQVGRGRITPAQAGRSPYFLYGKKDYKDPPRIGGEKYLPCFNADGFVGSPPRWRGKAVKFRCTCGLQRITPAWAGKSKLALCTPSCPTDHPRAGREKNKELEGVWLPMGSPPRRRGKERSTALVGTPTRITPALAGKSYVFGPFRPGSWDHPRVGGEKQIGGDNGLDKQGSPPRGRGKAHTPDFFYPFTGITPAWAGKSAPPDTP